MTSKEGPSSWLACFAVTVNFFIEQGLIKSYSVLLPDITEQFNTYTWIVGVSISFIFGWGCILGLAAGILVKISLGRVSLIACGILATIGLFICAGAGDTPVFVLGLSLNGFFVLQHIIGVGAIPEYFDTHFDTAVAIYCCGTGLGITVMPLITQALRNIYGWRGTLILLSGLCAHSIPCGALINIDKKKAHKRTEDNSSLIKTEQQESFSISECFKSISEILDLSLLTDIYFIAQILVPAFIKGFTFNGWLIYIVSFALSNGASYKEASVIATCGGIGLTAIRAFLPILHKILTFKQFIYLQSVLATISLLLMTQFVSISRMAIMSAIYGISFGILGAEMFIVIREVTNPSQHYSGVAWYSVFDGTGTVAGGFLTGYLFDMTWSFTISFTVLAVVSLMTAVCFGLVDIWDRIKRTKFAPL